MASETSLLKQFNDSLDHFFDQLQRAESAYKYWIFYSNRAEEQKTRKDSINEERDRQQATSYKESYNRVLADLAFTIKFLKERDYEKVKKEDAVKKVMEQIQMKLVRFLQDKSFFESEQKIKKSLDDCEYWLQQTSNDRFLHIKEHIEAIKKLDVSEKDFVDAQEKAMRLLSNILKAAEKELK